MNILITGANGFIGLALCRKMLSEGFQVRGAVRDAAQMSVLPLGVEGVQVGDIGPETDWAEALAGIEGIVHLAARVHVMGESAPDSLAAFRQVNTVGTECIAREAVRARVKRLVYISSIKVNGEKTEVRRQKSEVGGQEGELKEAFSEKDVPNPQDPYAVSKWEAEQVLYKLAANIRLQVVILRLPLVYGAGVRANFLRLLRLVRLGIPLPLASIKNQRSMIYLGNLVDVIIASLVHPRAAGNTFLVSDGRDLSTPELIRLMAKAMGREASLLPFSLSLLKIMGKLTGRSAEIDRLIGSLRVDSSKIRRVLGWKPRFTVEEGIEKTSAWKI